MSDARSPAAFGFGIALVVLIGFGALGFLVFDPRVNGDANAQLEMEAEKGADEIDKYKKRLISADKGIEKAKANRMVAEELASIHAELDGSDQKLAEGQATIEAEGVSYELLTEDYLSYKETYRQTVRAAAVGRQFDLLETLDGKTYKSAVVKAVDAAGMSISYPAGRKRIAHELLPHELQEEFQFGEDESAKLIAEESERRQKFLTAAAEREDARGAGKSSGRADSNPARIEVDKLSEGRKVALRKITSLYDQIQAKKKEHEARIAAGRGGTDFPRVERALLKKIEALEAAVSKADARIRQLRDQL